MVEIDVYYFFWLSMLLYPIYSIREGMPLSACSEHLGMARVGLESLRNEMARVFPNTSDKVRELLNQINSMVPPTPPLLKDRLISSFEATRLVSLSNSLAPALRDEAKHNYVLCVEDQKALSAHCLVEKIESCFSSASWRIIEKPAKREFEEAGKCLALERYTGAGFHALRGVEFVIRQYIVDVAGALPKKRDWGHYIEVLKQNGADPSLTAVLDNIRTLERNPLMHPEDWLGVDDAIGIFTISQTAIARLTADMRRKCPAKYPESESQ